MIIQYLKIGYIVENRIQLSLDMISFYKDILQNEMSCFHLVHIMAEV